MVYCHGMGAASLSAIYQRAKKPAAHGEELKNDM
jgi:hypothetical protein